jgi:hypothetical protein
MIGQEMEDNFADNKVRKDIRWDEAPKVFEEVQWKEV